MENVQGRHRLVTDDQLGLHGQGADDGKTLLLAAGKLFGILVCLFLKAYPGQQLRCHLIGLLLALLPQEHRSQGHVLPHGQIVEYIKMLEHHSHLLPMEVDVHALVGDVGALKINTAGGGRFQQVQAPQERGLSGTGRADDTGNILAVYCKINIL